MSSEMKTQQNGNRPQAFRNSVLGSVRSKSTERSLVTDVILPIGQGSPQKGRKVVMAEYRSKLVTHAVQTDETLYFESALNCYMDALKESLREQARLKKEIDHSVLMEKCHDILKTVKKKLGVPTFSP